MQSQDPGAAVAAMMNAAWWVRHYCRPGQARERQEALQLLAVLACVHLAEPGMAEPVLYAIAAGLYDRTDPRFQV